MTPLKHRNDGYITIQGGPYAGETVPLDDAQLFVASDRGRGYVFDPPCWRWKGCVHYTTARIVYQPTSAPTSA